MPLEMNINRMVSNCDRFVVNENFGNVFVVNQNSVDEVERIILNWNRITQCVE